MWKDIYKNLARENKQAFWKLKIKFNPAVQRQPD